MATAIKIYSTDSNENAIAKTVSNANPAASNYVLKNFGVQLMTLSNNAFRRAERIDTTDITNATDSDNITGAILNPAVPFSVTIAILSLRRLIVWKTAAEVSVLT